MKNYFYSNGNEQIGPKTFDEILELKIKRDTLIWYEGLEDWKKASELDEFKSYFMTIPPELNSKNATPPPFNNAESISISSSKITTSKKASFFSLRTKIILFLLIACSLFGYYFYYNYRNVDYPNDYVEDITVNGYDENSNVQESETVSVPKPRQKTEEEIREELFTKESKNPKKYLTAEYSYRVSLLGNTLIEGRLFNSASFAGFKNVRITVYFYSKTDALLGKETFTVMEFVPANESAAFKCKIEKWWDGVASTKYNIESAENY